MSKYEMRIETCQRDITPEELEAEMAEGWHVYKKEYTGSGMHILFRREKKENQ